jgi:hypothetical protein
VGKRYAHIADRIYANIKISGGGCWIWCGKTGGGRLRYGYLNFTSGSRAAHRVSYETFNGKIPAGKEVRHTCHETMCCNPDHLVLGTRRENMLDRTIAGRKGNKITPAQVRRIRGDQRTQSAIAAAYGITQSMVSKIKLRQAWPDVT